MPGGKWEATDLAYLAGIVDGEGCIEVRCQSKPGRQTLANVSLRVTVGNTDPALIEWLVAHFGGTTRVDQRAAIPRARPMFWWALPIRANRDLFEALLPWLVLKSRQLELALALADLKIQRGRGRRVPPENFARRLAIVTEVADLKRRIGRVAG